MFAGCRSDLPHQAFALSHLPPRALQAGSDPAAPLAISAVPGSAAELIVTVTPWRDVADAPIVEISVTGRHKPEVHATKQAGAAFVATVPIDVGDLVMIVARATAKEDGAPLVEMAQVNTAPLDPKEYVTAFSANGQLSVLMPPGALPDGSWLAFAPADVAPPADRIFVRGPQQLAASNGEKLSKTIELHFELPDKGEGGAHPPFDPATLRVERFDPEKGDWQPQPARSEAAPLTGGFALETDQLGIYAVTASR